MLRELKDSENIPGENKCQVSATKWLNHLENLISTEINVIHERKRQAEIELINAMNGTTSTFSDRPVINPKISKACRTLKNRKAPSKDGITNES